MNIDAQDTLSLEKTYQKAIQSLQSEKYPEALFVFNSIKKYKDANKYSRQLLDRYGKLISAGEQYTVALKPDGSVLKCGTIPLFKSARPTGTVILGPGNLVVSAWRDYCSNFCKPAQYSGING